MACHTTRTHWDHVESRFFFTHGFPRIMIRQTDTLVTVFQTIREKPDSLPCLMQELKRINLLTTPTQQIPTHWCKGCISVKIQGVNLKRTPPSFKNISQNVELVASWSTNSSWQVHQLTASACTRRLTFWRSSGLGSRTEQTELARQNQHVQRALRLSQAFVAWLPAKKPIISRQC